MYKFCHILYNIRKILEVSLQNFIADPIHKL